VVPPYPDVVAPGEHVPQLVLAAGAGAQVVAGGLIPLPPRPPWAGNHDVLMRRRDLKHKTQFTPREERPTGGNQPTPSMICACPKTHQKLSQACVYLPICCKLSTIYVVVVVRRKHHNNNINNNRVVALEAIFVLATFVLCI